MVRGQMVKGLGCSHEKLGKDKCCLTGKLGLSKGECSG